MRKAVAQVTALLILAMAFVFVGAAGSYAGTKKRFEKTYNKKAYTKKRFDRADADSDRYVTRGEAGAAARPVEKKAGGGRRFDAADTDNDSRLTLDEARKRKDKEKSWWRS